MSRRKCLSLYDVVNIRMMAGFGPGPKTSLSGVQCRVCKSSAENPGSVKHLHSDSENDCARRVGPVEKSRLVGWTSRCFCGKRHPIYANLEIRTRHP